MTQCSEPQFRALDAAFRGNAFSVRGANAGGAYRRMINRMTAEGLITEAYPRVLTLAGLRAYVDQCERRDAASGCIAFMERAAAARAALAAREAAEQVPA